MSMKKLYVFFIFQIYRFDKTCSYLKFHQTPNQFSCKNANLCLKRNKMDTHTNCENQNNFKELD